MWSGIPLIRKHFLFLVLHYARNVFIQLLFPRMMDKTFASFDGKNNLNINLRIGTWHDLNLFVFDPFGVAILWFQFTIKI